MCSILFLVAPRLWPFFPKVAKTPILSLFLKGHLRGFQFSRGQSIDKLVGAPTCSSCSKHISRALKFLLQYYHSFGSVIKHFGAWCHSLHLSSQFFIMLQNFLSRSHVFECFLGNFTHMLGAWEKTLEHDYLFFVCAPNLLWCSKNIYHAPMFWQILGCFLGSLQYKWEHNIISYFTLPSFYHAPNKILMLPHFHAFWCQILGAWKKNWEHYKNVGASH